jgi:hypothetical protein
MGDHEAMVSTRTTTDQSGKHRRIALTSSTSREARDLQAVSIRQPDHRALVGETPNLRPNEDVATRWPHIAFGSEHAEWGIEADPGDERSEIVCGSFLRPATERVLHVVAGQNDEVRPLRQTRSERPFFVRADSRSLDVRDVKDADMPALVAFGTLVQDVLSDGQLTWFDAIRLHVDSAQGKGKKAQGAGPQRLCGSAVEEGERDAQEDRFAEESLAHEAPRDLADVESSRIVEVRCEGRGE